MNCILNKYYILHKYINPQFSSVAQSCPTLCDPMDCSVPSFPVHHQLPEFTQTRVHWVGDAVQPSHSLSSPSPPAFIHSQHHGLFQWASQSSQFSHSVVSDSLRPHESQHARPPCPSPTPRVHSDSCPLSWWCHPASSSSVVLFPSCPQSLHQSLFQWVNSSHEVAKVLEFQP